MMPSTVSIHKISPREVAIRIAAIASGPRWWESAKALDSLLPDFRDMVMAEMEMIAAGN